MATFNSSTGTPTKPVISGSSGQWGNLLNTIIDEFDADFTNLDTRVTTLEGVTHVTAFLGLSDTPSSFTSSGYVRANSGGTALEFVTPSITHLSDTPANLGSANQILKMNSGGTALEWGTDASGGGGITVQDARNGLSHTQNSASGGGSFSYSASTGVMTYTPPNLSSFASSTNGTAVRSGYVNGTSSNSPFNVVGTYLWASGTIGNTSTEYNNGADAQGTSIYPAGAISFDTGGGNVAIDVSSSNMGSGTWKAMGQIKNLGTSASGNYMQHRHTLWLRIA